YCPRITRINANEINECLSVLFVSIRVIRGPTNLNTPMKKQHDIATRVIHAGQSPDPSTGAIMTPIYQTSTYVQESPGRHKGYDYSRSINPTRCAYERCVADLESGTRGWAFASGLAAMATALDVLDSG